MTGAGPPLGIVRIGQVPPDITSHVADFLGRALAGLPGHGPGAVRLLDERLDPAEAYDPRRTQYDCRLLLPELNLLADRHGRRVLGVADVDLFSPIFTFVFGEAHVGGRAGLFSVHRLRPAFYGLADDPELLLARARREALHETGHLLGLVHCRHPDCAMRFSGAAEEVDLKGDRFCSACRDRVSAVGGAPLPGGPAG